MRNSFETLDEVEETPVQQVQQVQRQQTFTATLLYPGEKRNISGSGLPNLGVCTQQIEGHYGQQDKAGTRGNSNKNNSRGYSVSNSEESMQTPNNTVSAIGVGTPIIAGRGYGALGYSNTSSHSHPSLGDINVSSDYSFVREASRSAQRQFSLSSNNTLELDGVQASTGDTSSTSIEVDEEEGAQNKNWADMADLDALSDEMEGGDRVDREKISKDNISHSSSSNVMNANYRELELNDLDEGKIYWNEDEEIFFHKSGMSYDIVMKTYFSYVNRADNDWRSLYYVKYGGDFKLAERGELG